MEWYVVNTFSGYENTVRNNLEDRIKANSRLAEVFEEILVPSEKVTERRGDKTVNRTKKFFPGYIFIKMEMTKEAWHLVQATPRVTGFLGGQKPKPVPASQMARMLGHGQDEPTAEEEKKVAPAVIYSVGDEVRVKTGAFANFTGEVEEVNTDKEKVWLAVSIFGRPTRVEVDFADLEPSNQS